MATDEGVYSEYLEHRRPHPRAEGALRWWHRQLLQHAEREGCAIRGGRVLEVGFGHGYFAEEVRAAGGSYVGLDISPALAAEAVRRGFDVREGRVPPLPDELAGSVDVVWMSHVLEHARDWLEAREMVIAAKRALRPGGAVVVVAPDLLDSREEFWNGDWSHGFPTTARRCVQLMHDCGLRGVRWRHHRAGLFSPLPRAAAALVAKALPYRVIDRALARSPDPDTGFAYSYMTVFGWRQIMLVGRAT